MQGPVRIALALALIGPSVRGYASSWCLWTQLYDLHAVATRCAGKPAPEVEAAYQRLRRATEAAILRDASMRAGSSAESAQAEMAEYAARSHPISAKRCQDPKLQAAVKIFEGLASSDDVAKLEAELSTRRDPYDGDCL